jgi:phosphoribosylanthranilate isomerase
MSIGVKICGLNQRSAVEAAVSGGADYLGFVFFPRSPRYVDFATAASLASLVPSGVLRVGLVVDAETDFLDNLVASVPLDMLQLHGRESPSRVAEIRESFGLPVIKAIPVGHEADFDVVSDYEEVADRLLFDARASANATRPGGNARRFDWRLLGGRSFRLPWLLAGGLDAGNLGEAVRCSGAAAVDVSSGVEEAPGRKSVEKITAFLAAAARLRCPQDGAAR